MTICSSNLRNWLSIHPTIQPFSHTKPRRSSPLDPAVHKTWTTSIVLFTRMDRSTKIIITQSPTQLCSPPRKHIKLPKSFRNQCTQTKPQLVLFRFPLGRSLGRWVHRSREAKHFLTIEYYCTIPQNISLYYLSVSVQCAIPFPQSTHSTKPSNLTESRPSTSTRAKQNQEERKKRTF